MTDFVEQFDKWQTSLSSSGIFLPAPATLKTSKPQWKTPTVVTYKTEVLGLNIWDLQHPQPVSDLGRLFSFIDREDYTKGLSKIECKWLVEAVEHLDFKHIELAKKTRAFLWALMDYSGPLTLSGNPFKPERVILRPHAVLIHLSENKHLGVLNGQWGIWNSTEKHHAYRGPSMLTLLGKLTELPARPVKSDLWLEALWQQVMLLNPCHLPEFIEAFNLARILFPYSITSHYWAKP